MSRFLSDLDHRRTGPREAILLAPFSYQSDLAGGAIIIVPEGFVYDGASVPRAAWSIVRPFGRTLRASVIHDWLYTVKRIRYLTVDQALADAIFREAMQVDAAPPWGVTWFQREGSYRAVRQFGREAWET